MNIKELNLKNFRNYDDLSLSLNSNKVIFIGKNAQGKTNLLEAVYYLSMLSPIKACSDSDLILWGKDFSHLKAVYEKNEDKFTPKNFAEIIINPPKKKVLKINDIIKRKSSDFISNILVVSFTSEDLLLMRGTPDNRRDWLDCAISKIYPAYSERLSKYNKIKLQKNNLLKTINFDRSFLDILNGQLVVAGSNIIFFRLFYLKEIMKYARIKHRLIAPSENLECYYNSSLSKNIEITDDLDITSKEIADLFYQKLEMVKQEEMVRQQALVGSHRDDITFLINGIDAKKFASQGQQRTVVLALKSAETELISQKTGINAIILLDDVLAELDNTRQMFLLDNIAKNNQTIITSTDTLQFDKEYLKDALIYEIIQDNTAKVTPL